MLYQYANGQLSCKNNVRLQVMFQTSLFVLHLHLSYMAHSTNLHSMISTVKIEKKPSLLHKIAALKVSVQLNVSIYKYPYVLEYLVDKILN